MVVRTEMSGNHYRNFGGKMGGSQITLMGTLIIKKCGKENLSQIFYSPSLIKFCDLGSASLVATSSLPAPFDSLK